MKKIILIAIVPCLIVLSVMMTGCESDNKGGGEGPANPPEENKAVESIETPAGILVYVDNSGSMSGYADGQNKEFINAVSDMKSLLPGKGNAYYWGHDKDPIGDIGTELAKHNFSDGDTPFPSIFAKMARKAKSSNSLTFFITDGIIGVQDASRLQESLGAIKNQIRDSLLKTPEMAIAVYRLHSAFTGYYYTHLNTPIKLTASRRPFFVIAIGKKSQVRWLAQTIDENGDLKTYHDAAHLTFGIHEHEKNLAFSNKNQFEQKDGKLKLKNKGGSSFNLDADLPDCLFDDLGAEYIKNNLQLVWNGKTNKAISFELIDHSLRIKSEQLRDITDVDFSIKIKLEKLIPSQWSTWNSNEDSSIATNTAEQDRTFALESLLKGILEGTTPGTDRLLIDASVEFSK